MGHDSYLTEKLKLGPLPSGVLGDYAANWRDPDFQTREHQKWLDNLKIEDIPFEVPPVSNLHTLVASGGKIVVLGGWNKMWADYKTHPQIEFWSGEQAEVTRHVKNANGRLPTNCHALIISRYVSHSNMLPILNDARRRRIVVFPSKSDKEVYDLLDDIMARSKPLEPEPKKSEVIVHEAAASEPKPKRPAVGRGVIRDLIVAHDVATLSNKASTEAIFKIAQEKGIPTTPASISQSIYAHRKSLGVVGPRAKKAASGPPPFLKTADLAKPAVVANKPVAPVAATPDSVNNLLQVFDDAIAGLQLLRSEVAAMAHANEELRNIKSTMEKLLGKG